MTERIAALGWAAEVTKTKTSECLFSKSFSCRKLYRKRITNQSKPFIIPLIALPTILVVLAELDPEIDEYMECIKRERLEKGRTDLLRHWHRKGAGSVSSECYHPKSLLDSSR